MPLVTAAFLVLALALAVVFGNQTDAWVWGPALMSLIVASVAALVVLIKQPSRMLNTAMLSMGTLCVAWFGLRAWQSPVKDFAEADLMLMGGAVGGFICVLAIMQCRRAQWILTGGIAALLLANLIVMVMQKADPLYRPLVANATELKAVTGFFIHYNYAASFLMTSSLWLLSEAWHSRQRILEAGLGLLGTIGLVAVWWTGSRGGLLAALIGLACFGLVILIQAKRNKAKWFPAAAIAIPFVALILLGLLVSGWQEIQSTRSHDGSGEVSDVLDNSFRLHSAGIAVSCIADHPMVGGGAQSFSWKSFQHWDRSEVGESIVKLDFVHNEWLQAATDYGLAGFGLLLGLITVVVISAVLRLCFEPKTTSNPRIDAIRLGGLAGLLGMLVHSNFSFIFHTSAGTLMLGLCLAATCQWQNSQKPGQGMQYGQRCVFAAIGLFVLIAAAPLALKGTRVTLALWPTHYSKQREASGADSIQALDRAIEIWPQAKLLLLRGLTRHNLALGISDESSQVLLMEKSLSDYAEAMVLHPHFPDAAINRANLLSFLGRFKEADEAYLKTIELQGGMEAAYRGHYYRALHLKDWGLLELENDNPEAAILHLIEAADVITDATLWKVEERAQEIAIHEALGLAYEFNDMPEEALASYEHAATIHYGDGRRIHLRSALLQAALANQLLTQREPSKALGLFIEAKRSIARAGGQLPENITAEQRSEFQRRLDQRIKSLREIGIKTPEEF